MYKTAGMKLQVKQPRRKLIIWALSIAAAIPLLRLTTPERKKKTIKMLTQEGKLVEVEPENLPAKRILIGNDELRSWIRSNKTLKKQ